jgi:hypothetical protein
MGGLLPWVAASRTSTPWQFRDEHTNFATSMLLIDPAADSLVVNQKDASFSFLNAQHG